MISKDECYVLWEKIPQNNNHAVVGVFRDPESLSAAVNAKFIANTAEFVRLATQDKRCVFTSILGVEVVEIKGEEKQNEEKE